MQESDVVYNIEDTSRPRAGEYIHVPEFSGWYGSEFRLYLFFSARLVLLFAACLFPRASPLDWIGMRVDDCPK